MNLVVGATGLLGNTIVRRLRAQGARVRTLVRRDADRPALEAEGVETVSGDLKDRASLDAACRGAEAVITTATASQRGGRDTVDSVDLEGNRSLVEAARKAGVGRFVFVSSIGVHEESPIPLFAAKAKAERSLRESGVPWTILAPTPFMDVWFPMVIGSALQAGQPVPVVAGGRRPQSFIAVEDVAAFAVAGLAHPAALRQRLVIGGPEALSWSDVVAMTGRVLGRSLETRSLEPGQPVPTLPPPMAEMIGRLLANLEQSELMVDTTETAGRLGVRLTRAETVLRALFG